MKKIEREVLADIPVAAGCCGDKDSTDNGGGGGDL
jgi:hypothetical protein